MSRCMIIAEIGVNHNGNLGLAKELVDAAAQSGADVVKFQVFKSEAVISQFAPKARYQKETTGSDGSQLEMVRKLELDDDAFQDLFRYCSQRGVSFLASPFDLRAVDFLAALGVSSIKIPSGEITNLPYLRKVGNLRKKCILSTGMCTLGDVEQALGVLEQQGMTPDLVCLLHCTTEYPAPHSEVNLRAMLTLQSAFPGYSIGYSDHTVGPQVAIAAVALGATVIEKHFTLDKNMEGPDHKASLNPREMAELVSSIRDVEAALGDGRKRPMPSEASNMRVARKSIVAAASIRAGDLMDERNLTVKRPGSGLSPMLWDEVCGTRATRDYFIDELIEPGIK